MILLLLLAVFAVAAAFAAENEGTQVFRLLGDTGTLPIWAPTVIGVGAGAVLVTLVVRATRLRARLREIRYQRLVDRHRNVIERLEAENARLREELAAASAAPGPSVPCSAEPGWPPPPTLPGPSSVISSPPIAPPPA